MRILSTLIFIAVLFVSGCQPSEAVVQTAMAQTQAALPTATATPTPVPTSTTIPTPTVNPCSDRGWSDITIYLHLFDKQLDEMEVGTIISTFFEGLNNTKNKINDVSIDACTEHARQLIISSLGNQIYAFQLVPMIGMMSSSDREKIATLLIESVTMINNAKEELESLGIHLDYR